MSEAAKIPDHESQKDIMNNLLKTDEGQPLLLGQTWYLIDSEWFNQWNTYIEKKLDRSAVPEISNERLIERSINKEPILRKDIIEGRDFKIVSLQTFNQFQNWFSCKNTISREVIARGMNKILEIELHPLILKICIYDPKTHGIKETEFECVISKSSDIQHLQYIGFDSFPQYREKDFNIRVWNIFDPCDAILLNIPTQTLEEANLIDEQQILFEFKDKNDEVFPLDLLQLKEEKEEKEKRRREEFERKRKEKEKQQQQNNANDKNKKKKRKKKISFFGFGGFGGSDETDEHEASSSRRTKRTPYIPGVCGLRNLGNTCFMNSALQCLSNCDGLTSYFLEGEFRKDINKRAKGGFKGEMAKKYGKLMDKMWSGHNSATAPKDLRGIIINRAPRFSGYRQQDSHELLCYLLDGLHEDLNKIKKKPYIEIPDSNGRPDSILAKEAWKIHQKRNDSIIVDLFQGLLKSKVKCPFCKRVSVTFDPYMYLPLPIPSKTVKKIDILLMKSTFDRDDFGSRPTKYSIEYHDKMNIGCLKQKFGEIIGTDPENLIFGDMDSFKVRYGRGGIPSDQVKIRNLKTKHMILCQFKLKAQQQQNLMSSFKYQKFMGRDPSKNGGGQGLPFIMPLPGRIKAKELYELVEKYVKRFTLRGFDEKTFKENRVFELRRIGEDHFQKGRLIEKTKKKKKNPNEQGDEEQQQEGDQEEEEEEEDIILDLTQKRYECIAIDWLGGKKNSFFIRKEAMTVNVESSGKNSSSSSSSSSNHVSVEDCFRLFSETEQLSPDNSWYCNRCKKHVEAYKKVEIWSFPEILIIQLKRFRMTNLYVRKINSFINFPIENLDLSKFKAKNKIKVKSQQKQKHVFNNDDQQQQQQQQKQKQEKRGEGEGEGEESEESEEEEEEEGESEDDEDEDEEEEEEEKREKGEKEKEETKKKKEKTKEEDSKQEENIDNGPPPLYDLIAVNQHSGGTGSGHYTCAAKNAQTQRWYMYADSHTSEFDKKSIQNSSAYLLVYKRKKVEKKKFNFKKERKIVEKKSKVQQKEKKKSKKN